MDKTLSKKFRIASLLLTLTCFISPSYADNKKTNLYILSVGIEPDLTAKGKRDWYAQDAEYMREAFVAADPLYQKVNSRVINGKNATRANVLEGLKWISEKPKKEDLAILFFSAHGDMDRKSGYYLNLFKSPSDKKGSDFIWGKEINQALSKTPGKTILMMDTCCAGGVIPKNSKQDNCAYVLACRQKESSDGQWLRKDIPHGYFVIAACEALSGLADKNSDRIVTFQELIDYLPARAKAMYPEQNAVIQIPKGFNSIPLAKLKNATKKKELWNIYGNNLTTHYNSLNCDGEDVDKFAAKTEFQGGRRDNNAKTWNSKRFSSRRNSIEGKWESRWNDNSAPDDWSKGTAEVTASENKVHIKYKDSSGGNYLIVTRRNKDTLTGRYFNLDAPDETTPWVGKIIDNRRIDGAWTGGRWDLRRKIK